LTSNKGERRGDTLGELPFGSRAQKERTQKANGEDSKMAHWDRVRIRLRAERRVPVEGTFKVKGGEEGHMALLRNGSAER